MKPIITSPASYLLLSCILTLTAFNPAIAEEEPMTDEHAQKIFDMAMEERDDGKIYDSIEKFEYILSRRPSLNRARLELAVDGIGGHLRQPPLAAALLYLLPKDFHR